MSALIRRFIDAGETLDRVVISPLPYAEARRLVRLTNQVPGVAPDAVWDMSTAQYMYLPDRG